MWIGIFGAAIAAAVGFGVASLAMQLEKEHVSQSRVEQAKRADGTAQLRRSSGAARISAQNTLYLDFGA